MRAVEAGGFVVSGLIAGLSSGTLGTGGGIVATPLLRFLGVAPYLAVGSTVPAMLPSALTGAFAYKRSGFVDFKAVRWAAAAGAPASFIGARVTRSFDGHVLMLMTAAVMLLLAARLLPQKRGNESLREGRQSAPAYLLIGAVAGFFSGLLGIGGGFIMVPALTRGLGFDIKTALGTSLATIAVLIPANLLGQVQAGNVHWVAAILLTVGIIPGAALGARAAIRAREAVLRKFVAIGLTLLALAYAALEIRELVT